MSQTKRPRPVQVSPSQPRQPDTSASTANQPNLLSIRIWEMKKKEDRNAIAPSIAAMIIKEIADLSDLDLQAVARFIDLIKQDDGCVMTPTEDFITRLVSEHYERCGITPEDVAEQLDPQNTDGFRCNFDEVLKSARKMWARYPGLVTGKSDEEHRQVA